MSSKESDEFSKATKSSFTPTVWEVLEMKQYTVLYYYIGLKKYLPIKKFQQNYFYPVAYTCVKTEQ